jgi:hypothetical protein
MEEILWHRRESRRKTEKTNVFLQPWQAPAYSKRWENKRIGNSQNRRPLVASGAAEGG